MIPSDKRHLLPLLPVPCGLAGARCLNVEFWRELVDARGPSHAGRGEEALWADADASTAKLVVVVYYYLLQSCSRGGRGMLEDKCYEIRRALPALLIGALAARRSARHARANCSSTWCSLNARRLASASPWITTSQAPAESAPCDLNLISVDGVAASRSAGALRPNARSAGGSLSSSKLGTFLPLADVICPGLAGAARAVA